jgi:uncharacterized membrane protein
MSERTRARVLLVGESWITHTVHQKGFDAFATTEYTESAQEFVRGLREAGHRVTHVPAHQVDGRFPRTTEELAEYDTVVISDVGANTFLLTKETFAHSRITTNRLELLADYVMAGGGLIMVGGYLSFAGIDGRARFGASPLARVLPVEMLDCDDRVEVPEGVAVEVTQPDHPIVRDIDGAWPPLLGYNRVRARDETTTVARVGADPLLVVGEVEGGRSVAFTSDLAPHWAPPEFVAWSQYPRLWSAIVDWAAGGVAGDVRGGNLTAVDVGH